MCYFILSSQRNQSKELEQPPLQGKTEDGSHSSNSIEEYNANSALLPVVEIVVEESYDSTSKVSVNFDGFSDSDDEDEKNIDEDKMEKVVG